ncbi:acetyl-CoA carboxylase biotin carboxylase subunit [Wenxinia saemankumensis]|uniref:3-methylcrotonyl-CoA carboxylase alpha subunit n=1 Tax=Wenxinia saemankumensis TaxID=1447782 RepID=A0A1M6GAE5_9RHOB|nr:acetyl/propionyl/methylcrotonyl-CoA carboxylase subunit alpha [Wenxinia saemankumensis]SHJ06864.1 3-methylcrotonyl-CoA carboxylase alpha subunit [Wenxinia saemankumensis]
MIEKLLIANRGEIAARIIATARRMGIATVAVHSDADAGALHVAMADEAVRIGPAPVAESYLDAGAIVEAARRLGADAIHPGYGFLSESPDFARAVAAAGLTFVGPPEGAIRAMGLKDAAKARMEEAGVPVVPGYHGADQDPDGLAREADRIGYPVLIKARAGGGGKGMRLVERAADFADALAGARREGQASFGDPAVLIERYVTAPRHVEMQVMADAHGNVVHLFERDCSLQRRHQKVIEEAPAPGMTDEVRDAMGAAAVQAARAIGYVGAGTVEFIADGTHGLRPDGFWFMEMNTRLQVEHPVTEAITGLDLVELQLRIANGERLPVAQDDLSIDGHAFEARIYAEDAARGFLPATGRLHRLRFPEASAFARGPVRVDSGVREGDEITPHYDPMIAKLIVHGPDRPAALARLAAALAETQVTGTVTNLGFLGALARHRGFAAGEVDTGLIGREAEALTTPPDPSPHIRAAAALVALGAMEAPDPGDPFSALRGFRLWGPAEQILRFESGELRAALTGPGRGSVDGAPVAFAVEGDRLRLVLDGHAVSLDAARLGRRIAIRDGRATHDFVLVDPMRASVEGTGGDSLAAPMPGLVKAVRAQPGDAVAQGQALIVLEAMKMEHTLRAPRDGTVAGIGTREGAQVAEGTILLTLEPPQD